MLSQPVVWLCMISATVASLIPDIISRTIENIFERNKVNKLGKNDQERQISQKDMIPSTTNIVALKQKQSLTNRKNSNVNQSLAQDNHLTKLKETSNVQFNYSEPTVSLIFKNLSKIQALSIRIY